MFLQESNQREPDETKKRDDGIVPFFDRTKDQVWHFLKLPQKKAHHPHSHKNGR